MPRRATAASLVRVRVRVRVRCGQLGLGALNACERLDLKADWEAHGEPCERLVRVLLDSRGLLQCDSRGGLLQCHGGRR